MTARSSEGIDRAAPGTDQAAPGIARAAPGIARAVGSTDAVPGSIVDRAAAILRAEVEAGALSNVTAAARVWSSQRPTLRDLGAPLFDAAAPLLDAAAPLFDAAGPLLGAGPALRRDDP